MDKISRFITLGPVLVHNSPEAWLVAAAIVLSTIFVAKIFKRLAIKRLSRIAQHTETRIDDALLKALQATRVWLITLIAIYLGCQNLTLPSNARHIVSITATLAAFFQVGLWSSAALKFWIDSHRVRAMTADLGAATSLSAVSFVGRVILWAVILLLLLENLGVNVTTLVASLGVGGIAIGFALQNILGDLFASLSIILDKPFVIGDFMIVDSYRGTVENIGIKTTRLRSIDGELLVFANGDLIKSRIRNYKHMRERRILFNFGVLYNTPVEKLENIPTIVREIIGTQDNVRFDRAHFSTFGASSLDFEVVYWMLVPDYTAYMDAQQGINLAMVRRFESEGIGFAFPTRTLYHEGPIQVEMAGPDSAAGVATQKSR